MQRKRLIERIVPDLAFQIQKKGVDVMVDVNSYAASRVTGRIGWKQRLAYTSIRNSFILKLKYFGPPTFGEFKVGKEFSPRAEVELMNTDISPLVTTLDPKIREWAWGAFLGMKKMSINLR